MTGPPQPPGTPSPGRFQAGPPPRGTPQSGRFFPGGTPPSGQFQAGAPPSSGRLPAVPTAIGPYTVQSILGRGGMGIVYAGWDPGLGRAVAVKVITNTSPRALTRFEREARALGRLSHPNVVPVHSTGVHNGHPFVAMELVQGESLEARLDRLGQRPEDEVLALGLPLARALGHAHTHGVVHRDVKPDNVLIGADGVPRLTDFGLALDLEDQSRLSQSGVSLGSPGWWSPEQAAGNRHAIGPATDVFGLGATLYHALAGRPPHHGESLTEAISAALHGPPPLAELRPGVRPDVAAIVQRCLAKDPADRFPSMDALAAALEAALASDGRPPPRGVPPWLVVLVALAALGVAFAVGRTSTGVPAAPGPPGPTTPALTTPAPTTPAPTTPAPGRELQELLERGQALASAHRFVDALPLARRAHELAPDDMVATALLGLVLVDVQHEAEAEPLLRRALELGAGPQVRARLGSALINLSRGAEAEVELDRAIAGDDTFAQAFADRAVLRVNRGRLAEAADDARRALALDPAFPRAHFALGVALSRLGRSAEAIEPFNRAIDLEGVPYPSARRFRGIALAQLGRYAEAIVDFTVAIDAGGLPPDVVAELRGNRGFSRAMTNDRAGARADYDVAFAITPRDANLLRKRATLAIVEGRPEDALSDLEAAIAIAPRDGGLVGLRGAARMNVGRWQEALVDLDQALALDGPGATDSLSVQNRHNHALACLERGRPADAEADASWMLEREPGSTKALVARARARTALGRAEEAVLDATRALELGAQGGFAQCARGEALLALGRKDDARRDLTEAVRRLASDTRAAPRARALLARCDQP